MLALEQIVIPSFPTVGRWMPGGATNALLQLGPAIPPTGSCCPHPRVGSSSPNTPPWRSPWRSSSHHERTSCDAAPMTCEPPNRCCRDTLPGGGWTVSDMPMCGRTAPRGPSRHFPGEVPQLKFTHGGGGRGARPDQPCVDEQSGLSRVGSGDARGRDGRSPPPHPWGASAAAPQ